MNRVTQEDELLFLCDRAIRELRRELRQRMKKRLETSPFPAYGRAESDYGEVMVGLEWRPNGKKMFVPDLEG